MDISGTVGGFVGFSLLSGEKRPFNIMRQKTKKEKLIVLCSRCGNSLLCSTVLVGTSNS